jgi:hypothetical protein
MSIGEAVNGLPEESIVLAYIPLEVFIKNMIFPDGNETACCFVTGIYFSERRIALLIG